MVQNSDIVYSATQHIDRLMRRVVLLMFGAGVLSVLAIWHMEVTDGTFKLDVHDILANDMHGIVLVTVHAERDGRRLEMNEVHIWHLEQGQAEEFWSFAEDVAEMDAFFG